MLGVVYFVVEITRDYRERTRNLLTLVSPQNIKNASDYRGFETKM